jgi:diguanylate cyclase (GGDEF)-like protein/PAS domain S-box-containing protein
LLVVRLVLAAVLAVVLAGGTAAWLAVRATTQEAAQRLVVQQTDEVEVVARLLASKIEQSQKVLRTVAAEITPDMLDSPSALEWLLQQGISAVRFFDDMQVSRQDGHLRVNMRGGRLERDAGLEPAERDLIERTLAEGKPLVSELLATRTADARVMFTMPLRSPDGAVHGVLAGALKLQSQGLLPPSMVLPERNGSRLLVFARDGTILAHSDPTRTLGHVRDEPGLASLVARWQQGEQPPHEWALSERLPHHVVSLAGMPLPQWSVARVSDTQVLLGPLQSGHSQAWWAMGLALLLWASAAALLMTRWAQPLAQLCQRIATGNPAMDKNTPARGGTEVDALARALQALQNRVQDQQVQHGLLSAHMQAVLDNANVGIVITRRGVMQVVGRHASQMLGYTPQDLQGLPARAVYASDADFARMQTRVKTGFAAHGSFDGDVGFLRKDGTPVWARVQGRALDPTNLGAGTVWILEDLTASQGQQTAPMLESLYDPLTRLLNRDGFAQRLQLLIAERSLRVRSRTMDGSDTATDGVLLFLDLDHFTVVNDVAGHEAGDDVLRHVARLLETQVRHLGWVARLGGDEFAVVLPGCPLARGQAVAEQLRAALRTWEPAYQGRSFTLGASVGLVVLDTTLHDVAAVLHAADMACYAAKRAGRNQVKAYATVVQAVSGFAAIG